MSKVHVVHGHMVKVVPQNLEGYILEKDSRHPIPFGIAKYAAGKDSWLRDVPVPCSECGDEVPIGKTEGSTLCEICYHNAGLENALLDGDITEEEFEAQKLTPKGS